MKASVSLFALIVASVPTIAHAQCAQDKSGAIFSDLFTSPTLDTSVWRYSYSWAPNGFRDNGSMSSWEANPTTLPADANPYSIANGTFNIRAFNTPKDVSPAQVQGASYISGLVETLKGYTCGYVQMTAQLPSQPGLISAFWLTPLSGKWPPELDVTEIVSNAKTTMVMTRHTSNGSGGDNATPKWVTIPDSSADFHTYGMEWGGPNGVTWYFDGKQVAQQSMPQDAYNCPMTIVLDVMSGTPGSWEGAPSGQLNDAMKVASVQLYTSFKAAQNDPQQWAVPPAAYPAPTVATEAPLPLPSGAMNVSLNGPTAAPANAPPPAKSGTDPVTAAMRQVAASVAPVDGAEAPLPVPADTSPAPASTPVQDAPAASIAVPTGSSSASAPATAPPVPSSGTAVPATLASAGDGSAATPAPDQATPRRWRRHHRHRATHAHHDADGDGDDR